MINIFVYRICYNNVILNVRIWTFKPKTPFFSEKYIKLVKNIYTICIPCFKIIMYRFHFQTIYFGNYFVMTYSAK